VTVPGAILAPRTISSRQTLAAKAIAILWIVLFGAGTLGMWLGVFHGRDNESPPTPLKWVFLAVWLAASSFIAWALPRMKKVRIDGSSLYVSNYLREIAVPLSEIDRVTENRWLNHHPVTIHLRHDTDFGRTITFMPQVLFFLFWRSHPIVAELRALAAKAVKD
jgi:hypothetical protein